MVTVLSICEQVALVIIENYIQMPKMSKKKIQVEGLKNTFYEEPIVSEYYPLQTKDYQSNKKIYKFENFAHKP